MKNNLLIIDGLALLFRAFYATSIRNNFMYNKNGTPTNAVQGFCTHLYTAIQYTQPTHVVICWDLDQPTFRNSLYSDYKAHRPQPPVEMVPQFNLVKEVTKELNFLNLEVEGFEVDDCIGTICNQWKTRTDSEVFVLTGDRDLLQLLDERITILLLQKGIGNYKPYTKESFIKEYNIKPSQFVDVKGLMGDPSDGYPGIKGIGEKTALKLIQKYHSVNGLYDNIENLRPSIQTKLIEQKDILELSQQLAEIRCDIPINCSLIDMIWTYDEMKTKQVLQKYELYTVLNYLNKTGYMQKLIGTNA